MNNLKQKILMNAKNIIGWKTNRKFVVFGVDDYGNVRLDSRAARDKMHQSGLNIKSRFDQYDSLENEEDLLMLYETLSSVKDVHGNPAVFTALSVPANIDFEKVRAVDYQEYYYELLPITFSKLKGYEKVWDLWQEGITKKLLFPQFHGREHLNMKVFKHNLKNREKSTMLALSNRSYAGINNPFAKIRYTAAYDFEYFEENESHKENIIDGLNTFEKVFGFRSRSFNPPAGQIHHSLYPVLKKCGVDFIETGLVKTEYQNPGKYKRSFNYTGKRNQYDQLYTVRNCVFEPTDNRGFDWVDYTLQQVATAFRWHQPAIISSHRVNFCGHIDEKNRAIGLDSLKKLLRGIVAKWPEVEFITTLQLAEIIWNKDK